MDGAVVACGGRRVEVQRLDGRETSLYPSVWLRDNCLCSDCFDPHTHSRLQLLSHLDTEVEATDVTVSDGRLHVTWNDGHTSQYEHQWLVDRDFSDAAQATRRAMFSQPPVLWSAADLPSVNIPRMDFNKCPYQETSARGDAMAKSVDDGNVTSFWEGMKWPPNRSVPLANINGYAWAENIIDMWHINFCELLNSASSRLLMSDDNAFLQWLLGLEKNGLFLLTDAPRDDRQLQRIGKRVSFLKRTNYGLQFSVKSKIRPSNLAFTSASLAMHTDLTYYKYTPGVQILHCIRQVETEGGENEFVDGFYVAEKMRREMPEEFHLLSTVPVDFYDVGSDAVADFHLLTQRPVIQLDWAGHVVRISWNNTMRDSFLHVELSQVDALYKAFKVFNEQLYRSDHYITHKLNEGEIVCFHNFRVLHGRRGYTTTESCERHLEGGYVDWDEMLSRRRQLMTKLKAA